MTKTLIIGQYLSLETILNNSKNRELLGLDDIWNTFCKEEIRCGCDPKMHDFIQRMGSTHFSLKKLNDFISNETRFDLVVRGDPHCLDWTTFSFVLGKKIFVHDEPTLQDIKNAFEFFFMNKNFETVSEKVGCIAWESGDAYEPRILIE